MSPVVLPYGLAAIMALTIGWQVWPAQTAEPEIAARPAASEPAPAAVRTVDVGSLAGIARGVLERPLFTPGRRPVPVSASDTKPAASAARDSLPRLTGVIFGPRGGRAIFAGPSDKSIILAPGGVIAGYAVKDIGPGVVTVSGASGDRVLRPTYQSSQTGSDAAPSQGPPR